MKLFQKTAVALAALMLMLSAATADAAANLRYMYKGPNFVALLWDYSPGENTSTVYNLYRDGALIYSGASYSYTDYTLTACTNYTFTVVPKYGLASSQNELSVKKQRYSLRACCAAGVPFLLYVQFFVYKNA